MDISKEYIDMCKKALEIQKIRESSDSFVAGDYFSIGKINSKENDIYIFICWDLIEPPYPIYIWLPRQDQLSELIELWNKKYSRAFFDHIKSASIEYARYPDGHISIDFEINFDSIEKHLLAFYMMEQHNKKWDSAYNDWTKRA